MQTSMPHPPLQRPRRKRPNYWLRRFIVVLILLSPVLIWLGYKGGQRFLTLASEGSAPRVAIDRPIYVAVLGVDEREADTGRSDTLLLVRLDAKAQVADVINIPRDTRISRDGATGKINAVYGDGGAAAVVDQVGALLGIPRPYYVKLNFQAFEEIVDQLGGVDLYVDKHYRYSDPVQKLEINIPAGQQHMNGDTALKYVRLRYDGVTNSDIGRIERQQQFLQAMLKKIAAPSSWSKMPGIIKTVRKRIATNIPEDDQLRLAESLFKARGSVTMHTLPGTPDDATGDWILEKAKWKEVSAAWSASR